MTNFNDDPNFTVTILESEYLSLKFEISKTLDFHQMIRRAAAFLERVPRGPVPDPERAELEQQFAHFFREYGH
jgi:hypothetical protein